MDRDFLKTKNTLCRRLSTVPEGAPDVAGVKKDLPPYLRSISKQSDSPSLRTECLAYEQPLRASFGYIRYNVRIRE